MDGERTFNISWDFCLKISFLVIFLYFLYLIKDLVIWFIFALVLAILFNFVIDFLQKKRIPRYLSAMVIYFGVFLIFAFACYKTSPIFLREIKQFSLNLPLYLQRISPFLEKLGIEIVRGQNSFLAILENNLSNASENILKALSVLFGGVKATFFIIFLAFFLSLEKNLLERIFANFTPRKYHSYLFNLLPRVRKKVSGWFISRVIGIIFVGGLSYLCFSILEIKYAFILGTLGGFFDFIPIVGPFIAAILIFLIAAMNSLNQALFALAAFVVIQQIENNLLFPLLFKKFIGIPPALVLIALVVGGQLWGFLGAILAIPLTGVVFELVKDYARLRKKINSAAEGAQDYYSS